MADELDHRCGTCARFVRVVESIDSTGEVRRAGNCLLGVWPSPLYETSTCSQWVRRGEFKPRSSTVARPRGTMHHRPPAAADRSRPRGPLPEDLLEMDANEFRRVISEVLRSELGVGDIEMAGRWDGGEIILKPAKEGVQERRLPIDVIFHKIVMIREKLRVLEQRINNHPKLGDDDKLQLQQYLTGCYGSLTTFNILFANREDHFVGQKGED
ncbi:MAG: hypothetical protein M3O36_02715 [Myxococcota bacterium]|nr:hypothetical protein [Myxococcota bacterium]